MIIGIIVADSNELRELNFKFLEKRYVNQFEFLIYEHNIIFVHSGIGLVNAAAATQELISTFGVNYIFNYGAVGGTKNTNIFDLYTPQKIFFHDVITPWYPRGTTPHEKGFFINAIQLDKNNNIASGNSFLSSKEEITRIQEELEVDLFDMEVAAIAQIAHKNNIPLGVIKAVSDIVGIDQNNLEDINTRIKKAGELAFKELEVQLRKLI